MHLRRPQAPAQHRADPDRRRGRRLARLHAQDQSAARGTGHDLRQLLRHQFLLLPVARHDPARPVPAQHADPGHPAAGRRLRQVPQSRHQSSTIATWLDAAGYHTAYLGKYLNQYVPGAGRGAAGLGRLARRQRQLLQLQLHAERERPHRRLWGERRGLSDRRDRAQIGCDHRARRRRRRAVLPPHLDLCAAQPVDLGAAPRRAIRGHAAARARRRSTSRMSATSPRSCASCRR